MKTGITKHILLAVAVLILMGCSRDQPDGSARHGVDVFVSFPSDIQLKYMALNNSHNVDRVLLLPLIKKNAAGTDVPDNFVPVFSMAKQIDVTAFPIPSVKFPLIKGEIYKVLAIGFNHMDYDRENPTASANFAFGMPSTLATLQLIPSSPVSVPGLFSCFCTFSGNQTFTAASGVTLTGDLRRIVSGLSLQVKNIPETITSVKLLAERLVTASAPADGSPMLWQTEATTDTNVLGVQVPAAGSVSFDVLLLPTLSAHATKLYLDISLGSSVVRYEINVQDVANVSSSNFITFAPNNIVSISGDYSKINVGFTVIGSLNLDTDVWDGLP